MSTDLLKKEIQYRASRRGMREIDLLFRAYVTDHLDDLEEDDLNLLRDLLLEYDMHIFDWLTGEAPVPKKYAGGLFENLRKALHQRREGY